MTKKELLKHLKNEVYCRLAPSKIPGAGAGVIAIRDIPKGIDPFQEEGDKSWISVSKKELAKIHPNVSRLVKILFVYADGFYWVSEQGLNTLSITQFLNHSKTPNLNVDKDAEIFTTKRDIKEGEELTIDYAIFDQADRDFD